MENIIKNSVSFEFSHFVIATHEGIIFASARDKTGKIYNFIIDELDGTVREQVNNSFEPISEEFADYIWEKVSVEYNTIPIYRTDQFYLS